MHCNVCGIGTHTKKKYLYTGYHEFACKLPLDLDLEYEVTRVSFDGAYRHNSTITIRIIRSVDSMFASSQWETALLCNDVSHWLGASLESALILRVCNVSSCTAANEARFNCRRDFGCPRHLSWTAEVHANTRSFRTTVVQVQSPKHQVEGTIRCCNSEGISHHQFTQWVIVFCCLKYGLI